MKVLLIDDIRTPVFIKNTYGCDVTHYATNYQDGIKMLTEQGPFDLLCLDHDLASYDENGKELTGYDVMLFLESNLEFLPKDFWWVSANPVGRKNMQACLDSIRDRQNKS